jgi:hypothetical protein
MLNKSEICVIVGGYPQNNQDTALLSLTIESFKRYGYDICLVSHSPINNDLQQASKYTIYSDENYSLQFPEPSSIATFIDNGLVRFQTNNGNRMGAHSFAILMNLKNALWLLKNKKYTHFIYVECDTFLTSEDQRLLEKKLEESNFMENDGWFMVESYSDISLVPVTSIFGGNINYFSNTLEDVNTADDYIKTAAPKCGYSLEAFIAAKFPNPEYYHLFKPRDLFSSKWLGISNYGAVAIPELDNNFTVDIDIVRNANDSNSIICVVNVSSKPELIHLKIYKDNQLENSTDLTTGPLYWWGFPKENTNVWRMEIYKNDKLISQVERTIEEIFWNYWSFFESRNLEN